MSRRAFEVTFGRRPQVDRFAPGRVNLIGEHTDYNDGYVLPFALPHTTRCLAARRDDERLRIRSQQEPRGDLEVRLQDLRPGRPDGWAAYVAGVLWALREAGFEVGGADLLIDGTVPSGAGLSSSAALECSVASAVATLEGLAVEPTQLALAAQRAENDFVGMPCGVMDQMASMLAEAGNALFLDTRTLQTAQVPFDPADDDLAVLVVDTRAPHRLVDGEYAERRTTCEGAAQALGVPALRDIGVDELDDALRRLPDERTRRRVRHVVTENERVLETVRRLEIGDSRGIGPLMSASHASLRDDYEVSAPELDTAVDAALAAGALGARMTGGGFGGSAIALAEAAGVATVADAVRRAFSDRGYTNPRTFVVEPSPGAYQLAGMDATAIGAGALTAQETTR